MHIYICKNLIGLAHCRGLGRSVTMHSISPRTPSPWQHPYLVFAVHMAGSALTFSRDPTVRPQPHASLVASATSKSDLIASHPNRHASLHWPWRRTCISPPPPRQSQSLMSSLMSCSSSTNPPDSSLSYSDIGTNLCTVIVLRTWPNVPERASTTPARGSSPADHFIKYFTSHS